MRSVRLVVVLGLLTLAAGGCTSSTQGAFARAAVPGGGGSPVEPVAHSTLGVAIDVASPAPPETALSRAIALYERGEPPPSSAVMTEMYRKVCADVDRARARHRAYDSGDELARRQDCYCAEDVPCSSNRDCTDLIACYPQLALGDAADPRTATF